MPNDFLKTPVFPGQPIPHHEHRKLIVILVIVLVAAIAVGVGLWVGIIKQQQPAVILTPVVDKHAQAVEQALIGLRNYEPATPAEIQSALKQLSKSKTKVTDEQKAQVLEQLKTR